jgi:hypothetical protein
LQRHARYIGIHAPPAATRRVCEQVPRFLLHSIKRQLSDDSIEADENTAGRGLELHRKEQVGRVAE